jgi:rubrerythrin
LRTDDNLKTAFAGESQAYMKYLASARVAEKEGQKQVARLFRALAESEKVHALNHLTIMAELGKTEQNLSKALDGETYEFTQMYPSFIAQADKDGNSRAATSFANACNVEKIHNGLLSEALSKLGDVKESSYVVCSACGHTAAGDPPDKCPICGAIKDRFRIVE